jgi:hypothetical protein
MHETNSPPPSPLDPQFAALRASVAESTPPASVDRALEAAIAREQRRARKQGQRAPRDRWLTWPLALAASVAALSLVIRPLPPDVAADDPPLHTVRPAGNAFIPVVPIADIERAGDAVVVHARLPRMTLAQLGLPVNPAHAADPIDAELLVRGDGSVLAVRFVY